MHEGDIYCVELKSYEKHVQKESDPSIGHK